MNSCTSFRSRLMEALRGRVRPGVELAWHQHVLSCSACRELLDSEEALEALLASLPEPRLPVALAQRVLARLEEARQATARGADGLDHLLDLDTAAPVPGDLSERVLRGVRRARGIAAQEKALDRLLEQLPEPGIPAGLAERTLDALEAERGLGSRPTLASFGRMAALAAAAVVLLACGVLLWRLLGEGEPADPSEHVAQGPGGPSTAGEGPKEPGTDPGANEPGPATTGIAGTPEPPLPGGPSEELLAALDVLENWDLLVSEDLDLQLASMDPLEREFAELLQSAAEDEALDPEEDEQG